MVNDGDLSTKCRVSGTWGAMVAQIFLKIKKKVKFRTPTFLDWFIESWETLYFTSSAGPDMFNDNLFKM